MPRALPRLRVGRVFLVDGQLITDGTVADELTAGCLFGQRDHAAAAGRVDPDLVELVSDLHTIGLLPARRIRPLLQSVGPPAQRSDILGPPADSVPVVLHQRRMLATI